MGEDVLSGFYGILLLVFTGLDNKNRGPFAAQTAAEVFETVENSAALYLPLSDKVPSDNEVGYIFILYFFEGHATTR